MANYEYKEVLTSEKEDIFPHEEKSSWKPFLRQLFVSSVIWTHFFAVGLCIGTPTVFVPQVRRQANSTEAVSAEMVSWLSCVFGYISIPSIFLLAFLMAHIGRKWCCILVSFSMLGVSIGYFLTTTPTHLLITEIFQGITNAGTFTTSLLSIVEYTSPKYRGFMLTMKTAIAFWGIWVANAIGTFTYWKYICVPSFINSVYSLTALFWPESPTWLASKGRIEECRRSHRWLRGCSEDSERELKNIIASQAAVQKQKLESPRTILSVVSDRQFYMPVTLSCLILSVHQLSGKHVCIIYALDMLKSVTGSESTAYTGMLILDGVTVFCMYIGCALSKVLKRRTLLFVFGSLAAAFLLVLSLYLYLCHLTYFVENDYVSISLLVGFSISVGSGPMILGMSLYGELIPSKFSRQAVIVASVYFYSLQATLVKISPYMFDAFDMHGTFLFFGISVSVCLLILYKHLPETKDKTIQEIEEYFK